jgi:hypothetical protein
MLNIKEVMTIICILGKINLIHITHGMENLIASKPNPRDQSLQILQKEFNHLLKKLYQLKHHPQLKLVTDCCLLKEIVLFFIQNVNIKVDLNHIVKEIQIQV